MRRDVTDTELAMLQVLWERGEATRRQVADALYPGGDAAHYATVQKLLERLEAKGYARHTREQHVLVYTATVGREELIRRRLRDMADQLCDGSLTPLLVNLVRAQPLSPRELDELHAFLNEQKRLAKTKGKSR